MKKSDLPILILAGAILVSAALVTAGLFAGAGKAAGTDPAPESPSATVDSAPAPDVAGTLDAAAAYRLEKLNEVNDMVLAREAVPEDYLRYLPEDLREPVKQYNADTMEMKVSYEQRGTRIAESLLYEHKEDPGDYERGELFYSMADRISTLSLYRNVNQLCNLDPVLTYTLAKEGGGSYGMWAYYIEHGNYGVETKQRRAEYLDSVDALLDQFDAARTALSTNPDKD